MDRDEPITDRITALSGRAPGEDPVDPYEDVDVDQLPDWWQRAIELFRSNGLRPYRPPRFEDGRLKHEIVDPLEQELGVSIRFVCYTPEGDAPWEIHVDGEQIGTIGHRRSPAGYSIYEMECEEFERIVTDRIDASHSSE